MTGTGRAPGKVILLGEHAVVYGQPALAVPVRQVQAVAEIAPLSDAPAGQVWIEASQVGFQGWLDEADPQQPLIRIVELTLGELGRRPSSISLSIRSTIPIASGLGSGAAVSVAIIRALCDHFGVSLSLERQSALAFEVEKLHHGHPSGIDNTVVVYEAPVSYVRGQPPQPLSVGSPFTLVIGDTGVPAATAVAVGQVRQAWLANPAHFERIFRAIGECVRRGQGAVERGNLRMLGACMDENHRLLQEVGVSSGALDGLVGAARQAGALGAKLSGAGLGGNMIALVQAAHAEGVDKALRGAGAARTIVTEVTP